MKNLIIFVALLVISKISLAQDESHLMIRAFDSTGKQVFDVTTGDDCSELIRFITKRKYPNSNYELKNILTAEEMNYFNLVLDTSSFSYKEQNLNHTLELKDPNLLREYLEKIRFHIQTEETKNEFYRLKSDTVKRKELFPNYLWMNSDIREKIFELYALGELRKTLEIAAQMSYKVTMTIKEL